MLSNQTTISGKILYIISRRYINKIFRNGRLKYKKDRLIFLPLDNFSERHIEERGFEIINPKEFAVTEFNNQRAWGLMNTIKSAKINGDVLSNYLVYRNISLIDLIDTEFLIFFLEKVIRQLESLIRLIDNFKLDKVIIATNSHDWLSLISVKFSALSGELIKLVSNAKNIPVINMSSQISLKKFNLICTIRPYLKFFRELVLSINSSVKYLMHREKVNNRGKGKIILLNHSLSANTVLPVMNEIEKIQRLDTLLIQISGPLPELGDGFLGFYKRWDYFFYVSVFAKMFMAWFSLRNRFKTLRCANFWGGIKYGEVKIGKLIREIFIYFVATRLLSAVKFIEMANWLFRKENVKFVVTPEERTLPNRAVCAAASFNNIPTLLIQRGLYGNHPLYRFPFLADKVALEGEWVKQILIKMGHDISKLEVTGQPAYDLLKEKYTKIDKTAICSKFNINTNNTKIILYTSQPLMEGLGMDNSLIPQDISSSHKQEIGEICLSLYDKKGILLLIKPHPNENDDLHYQIVNELKAKNIKVLSRKANIHELISISDILITRHSTTGLEAIVLDKPVIVINILGDVDSFPYVDYSSALGVYKRENIWLAVKSIFEDKQVNDNLKKGRVHFIRDFAYQIDGESSKRIVALINNMIEKTGGRNAS